MKFNQCFFVFFYTPRHNYMGILTPHGRAALPRRLGQGEAAASPYQNHPQLLMTPSLKSLRRAPGGKTVAGRW
jgi:hypothetical protein